MAIASGLSDYQVIQRDENDQGTITCKGTCDVRGEVWATVHGPAKKKTAITLDWHRVGNSADGQWSARIETIPIGGPYDIKLQVRKGQGRKMASCGASNVLVGDLWILAGQSNMQGCAPIVEPEKSSPWVHCYEMGEHWAVANVPLHKLRESPDTVHRKMRTFQKMGPGLPFAKALYARTGVPIGLVPCAQGGTTMEQWDPALKHLGGKSLYGSMMRRFHAVGGRITGMLWYQGEGDASRKRDPEAYKTYRGKFERFIEAVRRDFGDPELPFYLAQLSRVAYDRSDAIIWSGMHEDQRQVARKMPGVYAVSTIDLPMGDKVHLGQEGQRRLGRRFAIVAAADVFGKAEVQTGPRLKSVTIEGPRRNHVRVTFDCVNGRLKPSHHIAGFSLRDADGSEGPMFFGVILDRDDPNSVICQTGGPIPAGMNLWYGYGHNPYCNLADEQDMAALVFGPIPLTPPANQRSKYSN